MIHVGLIGFGYWGPNLARNFSSKSGCELQVICEKDPEKAEHARGLYPAARVVESTEALWDDAELNLVAIATPVGTHYPLARRALEAGKDVFLEKPVTETAEQAEELMALAEEQGRILAVDHTFLFTGAVRKIRELIDSRDLGDIRYFDAVRVNLGLFQSDVNVMTDLGPHDLSILEYLFRESPESCRAVGSRLAGTDFEDVVYLHLTYADGKIAHFHWNWLAPVKIRKTLICGSKKMIVYDDLERSEKIKVYDKGVEIIENRESRDRLLVDYRIGDMVAPKLLHGEALSLEVEELVQHLENRTQPESDGRMGLRVLRILEAARESMQNGGREVAIPR